MALAIYAWYCRNDHNALFLTHTHLRLRCHVPARRHKLHFLDANNNVRKQGKILGTKKLYWYLGSIHRIKMNEPFSSPRLSQARAGKRGEIPSEHAATCRGATRTQCAFPQSFSNSINQTKIILRLLLIQRVNSPTSLNIYMNILCVFVLFFFYIFFILMG